MKIAIAGCTGRMGQSLLNIAHEFKDMNLIGGSVRNQGDVPQDKLRYRSIPDVFLLTQDLELLIGKCDAIIDFTKPEYSLVIAGHVAAQGKIHVCGTTGFNHSELSQLKSYGEKARIFQSNNTSLMVHLVADLVRRASGTVPEEADIDIMEIHHHHKKDAPSGTALLLAAAAAEGRGVVLDSHLQHIAAGADSTRQPGAITATSLRMADVVGEHTVYFSVMGERIEISHKALSRDIFARGALRAARWMDRQKNGFYSMRDMVEKND